MSCQALQRPEQYDHQAMNKLISYEKVGPYSDLSDSYANLDTAFSESASMAEFQNKIMSHNPLFSQNLINRPHPDNEPPHTPFGPDSPLLFDKPRQDTLQAEIINKNIQGVLEGFGQQNKMEEKMNTSIDEVIGTMYVNDDNAGSNIQFPLTRGQHYSPTQLGTSLLENYDVLTDLQTEYGYFNTDIEKLTGIGIFKLILLLILIGALFYGAYWLCMNKDNIGKKTNIPSSVSIKSINRTINKIINS